MKETQYNWTGLENFESTFPYFLTAFAKVGIS